jgi:dimethylamine monooxygenase subunit A
LETIGLSFERQPDYFPPEKGRYSTTPDLSSLSKAFGNGAMDARLFQIDEHFHQFISEKTTHNALTDNLSPEVSLAVSQLMAVRLAIEYPNFFGLDKKTLHCALTGRKILINAMAFDALCSEVQEDIAIVRRTPERGDWNAAMHVSFPSRWAPEEKVGQSYAATHAPVPGTERSQENAESLVELICTRGPFVRFTWGLATTDALDLHPRHAVPDFDGTKLWFRVERQTLWPLPEVNAALFAIRVHLYEAESVRSDETKRLAILSALNSMSIESRVYKGLATDWDRLIAYFSAAHSVEIHIA